MNRIRPMSYFSDILCNTYRIQSMQTYFHKLEHNLREYGAFLKPKRSVSKLVTNNENIQIPVLAYVEFNPQASTKEIARECDASQSSVRKIFKSPKFHAYHFSI